MSLDLELALDRIEAALANELPAHVAAFARAYAANEPTPPAPAILTDPATLAVAGRARHDPRGRRLYRQCALLSIEASIVLPRARTWPALAALVRARDDAARRRWGRPFLELAHDVFDATPSAPPAAVGRLDPVPAPPLAIPTLRALWSRLTDRPAPELILSTARSRTFVVRPGHAIVVIRAEPTVAAWSNAVHELGHALAPPDLSRTRDEAFAIATARRLESDLAPDPAFAAAVARLHARQHELAAALAEVEASLYRGDPVPTEGTPAWALVHDPGAQAAYAVAHLLAGSS
jgi:hypothetical protein